MNPDQLVLLSEPRARHDSPATSVVAAEKVKPSHAKRLALIEQIVDDSGARGCTADELWQRVCVDDPSQLSRRSTWHGAVSRCAETGRIVHKGPKSVRLSVNNSIMRVYCTPRWLP